MKSLSEVLAQTWFLHTASHLVVSAVLGSFFDAGAAHAATQKGPCPARTSSLLTTFYKTQKARLEGRNVVPPELEPCLKTWHSTGWHGALYMWNESRQGEEPYSFVVSPNVERSLSSLLDKHNSTLRSSASTDIKDIWETSTLAKSSGHKLLEFQDVYTMCVDVPGPEGNAATVPGPNCSWVVVSPSDCSTWDLEMDNPTDMPITAMPNLTTDAVEIDTAITIARTRGGAVYHAPIDIISSLVHVNQSLLWDASVYLHVHTETDYVKEWLRVVGISSERLISSDIRAKRLYVPELHTESPSRTQLTWLQNVVWDGIGFPDLAKRNLLIVSKRKNRGISNHDELVQLAEKYAASHGLEVFIHDDEKLPPVKEQLEIFSRAVMFLAPHGAGESFIIASLPGACVIEMFPTFYHDPSLARLYTLLGHHYTGIELLDDGSAPPAVFGFSPAFSGDSPNTPVNITELRLAMEHCGDRAGVL